MGPKPKNTAGGAGLSAEEEAIRRAKGTDDIMDEEYIKSLRLECRDL
jgi:hypothetical protein